VDILEKEKEYMHQLVSVSKALRQRKLSSKKILGINGRTRGRK